LGGGFSVELGDFFLEEALGDGDVADELAFEGVVEAGGPGELADFADVVEDGAGDEEVGVDFGVEGRGGAADADEMENVFEEAAGASRKAGPNVGSSRKERTRRRRWGFEKAWT
jgi:uncharacterized protein YciU (UPF0263 family)